MAQISVRIDDTVKAQGERLFSDLGLTLSGAFNIFVRHSIRQGGIPFPVTIDTDPFYNPANMKWIEESIGQMQRGEVVKKTFAELEAMAQRRASSSPAIHGPTTPTGRGRIKRPSAKSMP